MPSKRLTPEPEREIARGSERRVYELPQSPDTLLKVMKPKHLRRIAGADGRSLRDRLRVRQAYALFRREQRAWTNAMLHAAVRDDLPPLAGVEGFILTPDGLGQMVERVRAADGETAPTLADLAAEGPLSDLHLEALNTFVRALYGWHIPAYDLGPKNIVWQDTMQRFLLVDGFGDRAAIPIVTWVRAANNWKLDRSFEDTANKSPLVWIRAARRFDDPRRAEAAPG